MRSLDAIHMRIGLLRAGLFVGAVGASDVRVARQTEQHSHYLPLAMMDVERLHGDELDAGCRRSRVSFHAMQGACVRGACA